MLLEEATYHFLQELEKFNYTLSGSDPTWELLFQTKAKKWHIIPVSKYKTTFYISSVNEDIGMLEVIPRKSIMLREAGSFSDARPFYEEENDLKKQWNTIIMAARQWLTQVNKNWIKANKHVQETYPLNFRYGTVSSSLVITSLPDTYRLDQELGKAKARKFIRLFEEGYFRNREKTEAESMTAAKYFDYCKIAYGAGARKKEKVDEALSGQELYRRYADGRHEGLLDIDQESEQEFADWLDDKHPQKTRGGHPWEIKRGGNTTHINLSVRRPTYYGKEGFVVELAGQSTRRLVETIKMFLAIYDALLPITISNPESIRKRLLGQDNIGIIPTYASSHRANQRFLKEEDVFDVMYYDDLRRFKRRITPFIRWETLPLLKPR